MKYKIVAFDFDGTLTDMDEYSWQVIHKQVGIEREVTKKAYKRFASGEMSYQDWVDHDIGLWIKKGVNKNNLLEYIKHIKLIPGTIETLTELKRRGIKVCLISGSLDFILKKLIPNYEDLFDYVFINRILFDEDGNLIKGEGTPFDMDTKKDGVKEICKLENIPIEASVFVGDNVNDLGIPGNVGLFIAFNSNNEELKNKADVIIEKKDLKEVLKYLE